MSEPAHFVEIFLQPGELHFGGRNTRIRTVLGSCVSLVFWHPRLRVGGMCHYMLPTRGPKPAAALDGRYGDEAVELMLGEIRAIAASPGDFDIRLFGGGNMFPGIAPAKARHVGVKNVETARRLVDLHRLRLVDEHVEGVGHRNLVFDVWSGRVALRHVALSAPGGAGSAQ